MAPLSGNDRGLQRAHVTNGIGEVSVNILQEQDR